MGLTITLTHKAISLDRKNLIQSLTVPSMKEEILSFLGIARIFKWVPSFFLLSHPLYEAASDSAHTPLLKRITKPFSKAPTGPP